MHNKPHTPAAKRKMSLARQGQPIKWQLPEREIVNKLLSGPDTRRSLAIEYGCSDSTVGLIFRKHTTAEQRLEAKHRKQAAKIRGRENATLKKWRAVNSVWTGRKHSEESRRKQSESHRGKVISASTRIKNSARLQGVSMEEWNGFATREIDRLRKSQEWANWRVAVFSRDDYTCQQCTKRGCVLHPHHIKPKSTHPDLVFDVHNGVTLCESCHKKTDSYGKNMRVKKTRIRGYGLSRLGEQSHARANPANPNVREELAVHSHQGCSVWQ